MEFAVGRIRVFVPHLVKFVSGRQGGKRIFLIGIVAPAASRLTGMSGESWWSGGKVRRRFRLMRSSILGDGGNRLPGSALPPTPAPAMLPRTTHPKPVHHPVCRYAFGSVPAV